MATGGVLVDLTNAVVAPNVTQMYGTVMSRPALLATDGKNQEYVCDVDCGITTPYPNGKNQQIDDLYGVPGTRDYNVDDSLTTGTILRNVPIANNNQALMYADIGNPVIVTKTSAGTWQVSGFGSTMPGTRFRYAVSLASMTIGSITNLTTTGRLLTLAELGEYGGGFGRCPLGASGLFQGGQLVRLS